MVFALEFVVVALLARASHSFSSLIVGDRNNDRVQICPYQSPCANCTSLLDGSGGVQNIGSPTAIAVDSNGNLIIADKGDADAIRKCVPGGNCTDLLAYDGLWGLTLDANDNIVYARRDHHQIEKCNPDGTSCTTVAGGTEGSGLQQLKKPYGVSLDSAGNYIIADRDNHRIQHCPASPGNDCTTIAGGNGEGAGANQLSDPYDAVMTPSGNLFVADKGNSRVLNCSGGGYCNVFRDGFDPYDLIWDTDGFLVVVAKDTGKVLKCADPDTCEEVAGCESVPDDEGSGPKQLYGPWSAALLIVPTPTTTGAAAADAALTTTAAGPAAAGGETSTAGAAAAGGGTTTAGAAAVGGVAPSTTAGAVAAGGGATTAGAGAAGGGATTAGAAAVGGGATSIQPATTTGGAAAATGGAAAAGGGATTAAAAAVGGGATSTQPATVLEQKATVEYPNCNDVNTIITSNSSKRAYAAAYKSSAKLHVKVTVKVSLEKAGSCARRLSAGPSGRRLSNSPAVKATYNINIPSGSGVSVSSVQSSMASVTPAAFTSSLNTQMTNLGVPVSATGTQNFPDHTTSATAVAGYDCFSGQGCYFRDYSENTHFSHYQKSPAMTVAQCAAACTGDAACEAFESLTTSTDSHYTCSFWKAGACNLRASNPPGKVTGFQHVTTCASTTRSAGAFTPAASTCQNSHGLGFCSLMLSIFLVVTG